MKVYIGVDSEGSACVVRERDPEAVYGTFQAEYIRKRATQETTAAVEGAREGGGHRGPRARHWVHTGVDASRPCAAL